MTTYFHRRNVTLFLQCFALILCLGTSEDIFSQQPHKSGTILTVTYDGNTILFGAITTDDKRFIGRTNATCSWITTGQKVDIYAVGSNVTIQKDGASCPFVVEKIVPNSQQQPEHSTKDNQINASLPIFSANGFTCRSKGENVVSCTGSFPSNSNIFLGASGAEAVTIEMISGKTAYSYESATGCLCETSLNKKDLYTRTCKSKFGKTRESRYKTMDVARPTDMVKWCYKN